MATIRSLIHVHLCAPDTAPDVGILVAVLGRPVIAAFDMGQKLSCIVRCISLREGVGPVRPGLLHSTVRGTLNEFSGQVPVLTAKGIRHWPPGSLAPGPGW